MRVSFRQGIVQYTHPTFIQIDFPYVNLIASHNSPLLVNIAYKTSNYLHIEQENITHAWGPLLPNVDSWLYLDIDKRTGNITYGITYIEPIVDINIPSNPQDNQHWFDTNTNEMKVWTSNVWAHKIRVFICKVQRGSTIISIGSDFPNFSGTQIRNNTEVLAGYILYDANNSPLKTTTGQFITSEEPIRIKSFNSTDVKIASLIIEAYAAVTIPAFTVVEFTDFRLIQPASAFVTQVQRQYGIIEQDVLIDHSVNVVTDGLINNLDWDWTSAGVNAFVYNDNMGIISTTPTIPDQIPIGIVLDIHTILFTNKSIVVPDTSPLRVATDQTRGVTRLNLPANNEEDPISVGDNDPRLSDYRHPLTHNHIISDITNLQLTLDSKITLSGGTLTGDLILNRNPITNLGAATKQYVDNIIFNSIADVVLTTPTSGQGLTYNGTNWINSTLLTSVGVSGGTTGLYTTGGPITSTGTITLTGVLNIVNGGTGLTSLGTSLQILRTNSTATAMEWINFSPAVVGLDNVNNTADMDKPVSTAQAFADLLALTQAKSYADGLTFGLWDDRGSFNASVNTFPTGGGSGLLGAILKGDVWTVNVIAVSGPLVGYPLGTLVRALTDTPGQTVGNWAITQVGLGYTPANVANPLSQFASTTSAQLAGIISNETGSGLLVFNNSPTFITPILGTPASGDFSTGNFTWPTNISSLSSSASALKSPTTSGVISITGPADGTTRIKTVSNANDTILELGGTYSPSGTWTYTGQIISTKTYSAVDGAGNIFLNSAGGNRIDFTQAGIDPPAFTTRSAGTKIVLWPAMGAASVDYALGIEGSALWFTTSATTSNFKWYGGITQAMLLSGTGNLTLAGTISGTQLTSTIATGTAPLVVTSTTAVTNLSIGGTAAKATILATTRAIYGNNFDGSAALTGIIASTYGGTGNGFTKFTGPTTAERVFTLPDQNATLLFSGGTASININGTVGATTPTTGVFTTSTATNVTSTSLSLGTQSIATAGATTTFTVTTPHYTIFTGTLAQTVVLPDATTLKVGWKYGIDNSSTLSVTVNTNGGSAFWIIAPGCDLYITCTSIGTAAGTWEKDYTAAKLANGKVLTVNNTLTFTGTDSSSVAFGTGGTVLYSGGALGTPSGGTVTNLTGTASININGTVGATTPTTGKFTSLTIGTLGYTAANALATMQSSVAGFDQVIIQNSNTAVNASSDFVVNNNVSTDTTYYGDFGINSSTFTGTSSFNLPNATYLTATTGDLSIGTTTSNAIHFVVNSGATDALTISNTGNLTTTGTITSTAANNTATGGGQIYLNGATGNRIDFNVNGFAAPTVTTRSAGTKLVLYPMIDGTHTDYAIGVGTDNLWLSVSDSTQFFRLYAGTTQVMSLSGTGSVVLALPLPVASGGTGLTTVPHTVTVYTSGSGTYTTPTNCKSIQVTLVAGGGGGAGSGTGVSGGSGGAGGNTTFGTTLLVANGGAGGVNYGVVLGGATALNGVPGIGLTGQSGSGGIYGMASASLGGRGGCSPFFNGGGSGGAANAAGNAAITNTGGGGGGGSMTLVAGNGGGGGGGGGGVIGRIATPAATYSYAVGAAGTAGILGTTGTAGGTGGSGIIFIEEFYV